MRWGGETCHVEPDLGDDDLGGSFGDAGDLVESLHGAEGPCAGVVVDGYVAGGRGVTVRGRRGFWELCDELLDAGGEPVDLVGAGVDLVQQEPGQVGVVVIEAAVEHLHQRCPLGVQLPAGQLGQDQRVAFAGDERLDHLPRRHPEQVCRHRGQLDQGVFEQLLEALVVPRPFLDQLRPQPGVVPQHPDLPGRHEARAEHAPLAGLGQPHGVEAVGFGPARNLLDVAGVDQPHRCPPSRNTYTSHAYRRPERHPTQPMIWPLLPPPRRQPSHSEHDGHRMSWNGETVAAAAPQAPSHYPEEYRARKAECDEEVASGGEACSQA
jgi:hypothetical protein